jgi:UDP:flavonoid glycosyltransferase YjiC (YdhE family)
LGHATRCSVLIDDLLQKGHEVIIASNGRSAAWLQQRYPQLEVLTDIPDYAVTYPSAGSMAVHFAKQLPRLIRVVRDEHRWLERLITERSIDSVYSDNRYGLHHQRLPCTFITHQLHLRVPWWSRALVHGILNRYLKRFQSIWIPDYEKGNTLSGALSHGAKWDNRVQFIGPLSRFAFGFAVAERSRGLARSPRLVALISGPEPSRTAFEKQLRRLLVETGQTALLLLGRPDEAIHEVDGNLTIINHLPDEQLAMVLKQAQLVICRSGYSTIMDLHALKCRALLVPTPGQTEQEYLAEFHAERKNHNMVLQPLLTAELLESYLKPLSN